MRAPPRIATRLMGSSLPDAEAAHAQADGELDLHVAGAVVGHRVVGLVELGQQAQPVLGHVAARLDARLVLVEAQVGREAGHADVHARLGDVVVRVALAKARLAPDIARKLDDVDGMMVAALLLHDRNPSWRTSSLSATARSSTARAHRHGGPT